MGEIQVTLPSGRVITFPEGTPFEIIQAKSREALVGEVKTVPFKDGVRPDTGTNLGENAATGLTAASLASAGGGMLGLARVGASKLPVVGKFVSQEAPRIGSAVGGILGSKVGHPWIGSGLGGALGDMARRMGRGGKKPVATPSVPPTVPRGTTMTGGGNGSSVLPGGSPTSVAPTGGFSMRPSTSTPGGTVRRPPTTRSAGEFDDILERVRAGASVDGAKLPNYPANVATESSFDDLIELILGTQSRTGSRTPMMFHGSAPDGMRNSIDGLKRKVNRRRP